MKRWVWLLALSLALPAGADDKKKDEKKKDEKKPAAGAVAPSDLLKQADEKTAAGDLDGALELLRKAQGAEATAGEASIRLGRALEAKYDLDVAIDAYRVAGEKLSGPVKGEALGRMAILQDARGMAEATATAQAAAAADPAGPRPTIAMSLLPAPEGKGDEAVEPPQHAPAPGGGAAAPPS